MGRSTRFANQAVQIRLAKFGCTNRPFYHIVAAKAHRARDNKPLDQIGTYDPLPNQYNEKLVSFNFEKLHKWINQGARPSKIVGMLLGLAGFFPMHPMCIVQAKRNRKEQRLKEIELDKKRLETEEENARQNETAV